MVTVDGVAIPFYVGLTPAVAICAVKKCCDVMTLVMVDGKVVSGDALDMLLTDGSEIRLLRLMSGG